MTEEQKQEVLRAAAGFKLALDAAGFKDEVEVRVSRRMDVFTTQGGRGPARSL